MELALGTVQFGLDYGISNTQGQVDKAEVIDILMQAKSLGINTLDCAGAYGNSEHLLGDIFKEAQKVSQRDNQLGPQLDSQLDYPLGSQLGNSFNIISKIPALNNEDRSIKPYFFSSLKHLQQDSIESLLFHHADNLLNHPDKEKLFKQALSLKSQGLIKRIGVSVYTPKQLISIAQTFPIELVQTPINIFDQRFISTDVINFCQQKSIKLHARSLFLQGLLFIEQGKLAPYFLPYQQKLDDFAMLAQHLNCTKLTLALAIVVNTTQHITAQKSHTNTQKNTRTNANDQLAAQMSNNVIEKLVVGVCNTKQLTDIVEAYQLAKTLKVSKAELLALADDRLGFINPSLWSV